MERVRNTFKTYDEYRDFYTNSVGYPLERDAITDDDNRGIPTFHRWEYGLKWLKELDCKTVFDIGSWTGRWPTVMIKNGFNIKCIEANKAAFSYAIKDTPLYGKCVNRMFEDFAADSGDRYDAITAFEVIEHVYDMEKFIGYVDKLLKIGGYFIFSTPAKGGCYDDNNEIHLWIATIESLMETFKDWEIIDYDIGDLILMVVRKKEDECNNTDGGEGTEVQGRGIQDSKTVHRRKRKTNGTKGGRKSHPKKST